MIHQNSRDRIANGAYQVAEIVRTTAGPNGGTVAIHDTNRNFIHPTKDGFTVAMAALPEGDIEQIGASIFKSASAATATAEGDGTTATLVLAMALLKDMITLQQGGMSVVAVQKIYEDYLALLAEEVKKSAIPVGSPEDLYNIALISSNGNSEMAEAIQTAWSLAGLNGFVEYRRAEIDGFRVEYEQGLNLETATWAQKDMVYDKRNRMQRMEGANVIVFDATINTGAQIQPILAAHLQQGAPKPTVFVCRGIGTEALKVYMQNQSRLGSFAMVSLTKEMGEIRTEIFKDIAKYTGAELMTEKNKFDMDTAHISPKSYGHADFVSISDGGVIIKVHSDPSKELKEHIFDLESRAKREDDPWLKRRIGQLTSGYAVIEIGSPVEETFREMRDSLDDSVRAAKSAINHGFVAGGGVALVDAERAIRMQEDLPQEIDSLPWVGLAPIRNLNEQGTQSRMLHDDFNKAIDMLSPGEGFDFSSTESMPVDMVSEGIIDAGGVVLSTIRNAKEAAFSIFRMQGCITIE